MPNIREKPSKEEKKPWEKHALTMKTVNAKELRGCFTERMYRKKESLKGYNGRKTDHAYGGLVFLFLCLHKVEKNK